MKRILLRYTPEHAKIKTLFWSWQLPLSRTLLLIIYAKTFSVSLYLSCSVPPLWSIKYSLFLVIIPFKYPQIVIMNLPVVFNQAINVYSVLCSSSYNKSPKLLITFRALLWTTDFPLSLSAKCLQNHGSICITYYHSYIEGKYNYSALWCYSSKYTTKDHFGFSALLHISTYQISCLWRAGVDVIGHFPVIIYFLLFMWLIFQINPYPQCNQVCSKRMSLELNH